MIQSMGLLGLGGLLSHLSGELLKIKKVEADQLRTEAAEREKLIHLRFAESFIKSLQETYQAESNRPLSKAELELAGQNIKRIIVASLSDKEDERQKTIQSTCDAILSKHPQS